MTGGLLESRLFRILAPVAILFLFYRTLFLAPPTASSQNAPGVMDPDRAHKLVSRARDLQRREKYEESLAIVRELHAAFPDNHIYLGQLATLDYRLGQYAESAATWEKYLLVAPNPVEACPGIGQAYEKAARPEDSVKAFERCLEIDPSHPDSLFFLARAKERTGHPEEALELYRRGIEISPNYPDLAIGFARVQFRQGRRDDAWQELKRILQRWPGNSDALLLAGQVLRAQGDLDGAKSHLLRGVERSPGYTDLWLLLGGIAEQQDRDAEALRYYEKALLANPADAAAAAARDRLGRRQ